MRFVRVLPSASLIRRGLLARSPLASPPAVRVSAPCLSRPLSTSRTGLFRGLKDRPATTRYSRAKRSAGPVKTRPGGFKKTTPGAFNATRPGAFKKPRPVTSKTGRSLPKPSDDPDDLLPLSIKEQGLRVNVPKCYWPEKFHPQATRRKILPYFWLRDNCRCPDCVNPETMQRSLKTFEIPEDVRATKVTMDYSDKVRIEWSDGHKSTYDWQFIAFYVFNARRNNRDDSISFFGREITQSLPMIDNEAVMSSTSGVSQLTGLLKRHGFALVPDTPHDDPIYTKKLLERIAFIRQTHYGGFYDFIPDLSMADTAYTNLSLAAHTDTTYFTDPAGLQAFHLLSHKPPPGWQEYRDLGGKTLLVDGFKAAQVLRGEDPKAYRVLSRVPVPWHASGNKGITISPDQLYPVLEHDDRFRLKRIRWNNDDRGVIPWAKYTPPDWYRAARKWDEILRRRDMELWFQMKPGTVLIFDNWRVLHGRSAFSGTRRICGGYINRDDWISRWRNTNYGSKEARERAMG